MYQNERTSHGKEWRTSVFDCHTFDCKKKISHIQVRMNTANKLICLQLARCVSFVHDDVHTCSSSLCEWSIEYCKTRVHIESKSLSYGDTANDGSIPIRFILTDSTNDFTVDDVECVGGELLDFKRQEPLIYTATFNSADSETATRRIIVPAHVFTDSHGASNHESVFQWNYDNSGPNGVWGLARGAESCDTVCGNIAGHECDDTYAPYVLEQLDTDSEIESLVVAEFGRTCIHFAPRTYPGIPAYRNDNVCYRWDSESKSTSTPYPNFCSSPPDWTNLRRICFCTPSPS